MDVMWPTKKYECEIGVKPDQFCFYVGELDCNSMWYIESVVSDLYPILNPPPEDFDGDWLRHLGELLEDFEEQFTEHRVVKIKLF